MHDQFSHNEPFIFLDDEHDSATRYYSKPIDIICARSSDEIDHAFAKLTDYHFQGYYLAGFASYELGLWLEPKLRPLLKESYDTPFIHFGVFKDYTQTIPCLLYTSPSPRDQRGSRMPSSA